MELLSFRDIILFFNLKNDLTDNKNIWVGHAKIGYRDRLSIMEAKRILSTYFNEHIPENIPTPKNIQQTLKQWENSHPFQKVREEDQPLFIKQFPDGKIEIAVIWPWQLKDGVASLMLYEGEII